MNINDTKMILGILKSAYPAFYKDLKKDEAEKIIELWAMMFEPDNFNIIKEAVKVLMCTLKFPPTIADVKEKIALITQPKTDTELEMWNKVLKAISYYSAKENFDSLEPILQKLVGSPNQLREWSQMETSVLQSVVQSNFMRSYKAKVASEKEYTALPESTKLMIEGLSEKMELLGG